MLYPSTDVHRWDAHVMAGAPPRPVRPEPFPGVAGLKPPTVDALMRHHDKFMPTGRAGRVTQAVRQGHTNAVLTTADQYGLDLPLGKKSRATTDALAAEVIKLHRERGMRPYPIAKVLNIGEARVRGILKAAKAAAAAEAAKAAA